MTSWPVSFLSCANCRTVSLYAVRDLAFNYLRQGKFSSSQGSLSLVLSICVLLIIMYASELSELSAVKEEELNLFEASGIRKKAFWQCIRYIAPDASGRKWKAGDAVGVYCTVCKARINYDSVKNPKAVQRHMCKYHKKLLEEYDSFAKRRRKNPPTPPQERDSKPLLKPHAQEDQLKFSRMVARWTALSLRPLGILEDPLLQELVSFANAAKDPLYLPSGHSIKNTLLSEYEDLQKRIHTKIQESCHFYSLSTHLWSSRCLKAFMTVTLHFLAEDFNLRSFTLDVVPVGRRRDLLRRDFFQLFKKWNLSQDYLTMILRDTCREMMDACEEMGVDHFPCIDSSLHRLFGPFLQEPKRRRELPTSCDEQEDEQDTTIIDAEWLDTDSLNNDQRVLAVRRIVQDLRGVWAFIRSSRVPNEQLESLQKQLCICSDDLNVEADARTSALDMISKMVQSMAAINEFLGYVNSPEGKRELRGSSQVKAISEKEWAILKGVLYLLSPFGKATAALREEMYSSFVSALPVLRRVKDFLSDPGLFDFQKSPLSKTKKRYYSSYGDTPFFQEVLDMLEACRRLLMDKFNTTFSQLDSSILWTTLLDPRLGWKSGHWKGELEKELAKKLLLDEVEKLALSEFQLTVPQAASVVASGNISDDEDFDLDFNKTTSEASSLADLFEAEKFKLKSSLVQELEAYLSEDSSSDNPLKWWQRHRFKYPNVARVARKWLTVTAASTPSNRIFSSSGFVDAFKSSDFLDETLRAQVFVHNNYHECYK